MGENYPTGILIDVIFRLANNKILTVQKQISEVTLWIENHDKKK